MNELDKLIENLETMQLDAISNLTNSINHWPGDMAIETLKMHHIATALAALQALNKINEKH
jgi:hypothetical protein